jgi:hypothetical protein
MFYYFAVLAGVALVCVPFVFVICFVNLLNICYTEWWLTRKKTFVMVPGRPTYRHRSGDNTGGGEGADAYTTILLQSVLTVSTTRNMTATTTTATRMRNNDHDHDHDSDDEQQQHQQQPPQQQRQ